MNYDLAYNPAAYPASQATNSTYLFSLLGFFWQRIFQDQQTLNGLTVGQSQSAIQDYYELIELINSYSCYQIPVFETRAWYPLTITKSSLNNNDLLFGEGVLFGAEVSGYPYIFGRSIPEQPNVFSVILPSELMEVAIVADQIITPNKVWVNGQDFYISGERLFFNGNPFSIPNLNVQNIYNANGTPSTYFDYTANAYIQDKQLILWCYNAKIDTQNLDNSIAYLFGLNVPSSETSKEILSAIVQNFTNGPSINDIKAVALASLGLPIIKNTSTISNISTDDLYTVITTNNNVYRYPISYPLKPQYIISNAYVLNQTTGLTYKLYLTGTTGNEILNWSLSPGNTNMGLITDTTTSNTYNLYLTGTLGNEILNWSLQTGVAGASLIYNQTTGTHYNIFLTGATGSEVLSWSSSLSLFGSSLVLNAGDCPVQAVDLFDSVNYPDWWITSLSLFNGSNLPLQLPQTMLLGGANFTVAFPNSVEAVTVGAGNKVTTFPVMGDAPDIKAFLSYISTPTFVQALSNYFNSTVTFPGSTVINPVDFFFQSFLKSTTALLRVKFNEPSQLSTFITYFNAIRSTLPPQILFMVLCDFSVGGELFSMNTQLLDSSLLNIAYPLQKTNDQVNMNGTGATCLNVNDLGFSRVWTGPINCQDLRNISLTVVP